MIPHRHFPLLLLLLVGCETNGASVQPPGPTEAAPADTLHAGRLLPVDEADEDPSFFAFRMQLMEAVAKHDAATLLGLLDDDIHLSFGGDAGRSDFERIWRPSDPKSEIWAVLGRILAGGGAFYDAEGYDGPPMFQAPYYYALFPGEDYDPFTHAVILGPNVLLRDEPDGAVIDTLSFDIVRREDFSSDAGAWIRVRSAAGEGFVPAAFAASPIGYRAAFQKSGGLWRMTALVAGD